MPAKAYRYRKSRNSFQNVNLIASASATSHPPFYRSHFFFSFLLRVDLANKRQLTGPRLVSFLKRVEEQTAGFTERIQAAVDAHSVQLLAASAVDLQDLEARSDVPDVGESDVCELAAPLHGDADAAEESADHVAQVLAAVETRVGVGPHAVHGADSFRFSQHIFESDLKH